VGTLITLSLRKGGQGSIVTKTTGKPGVVGRGKRSSNNLKVEKNSKGERVTKPIGLKEGQTNNEKLKEKRGKHSKEGLRKTLEKSRGEEPESITYKQIRVGK